MIIIAARIAIAGLVAGWLMAADVHAQDTLASARDLYASAQYDEALKVLDALPVEATTNDVRLSVDLYRTLCLLAVGRSAEADRAIEQIVMREPLFRPSDDLPPRTRLAFSEARRRVLPAIVQQQYAEAKRIFDRKEFESAAAAFKLVIDSINDPDLGETSRRSPLSDLLTLAVGFHDLAVKAIPPPPPPPPPAPEPPVDVPPRIFGGDESGLKTPTTIAQDLPRFPGIVPLSGLKGVIEVIINEAGRVESAHMVAPVTAAYDKLVLSAANRWQYVPAMHNNAPVKFRKRVQINIAPPAR
jgi:TonB family protein